jgi:hypothetical protein
MEQEGRGGEERRGRKKGRREEDGGRGRCKRCKRCRRTRGRDGERKSMHDALAEMKDMRCDLVQAKSFYRAVRGTWQGVHSPCDEEASKAVYTVHINGAVKED